MKSTHFFVICHKHTQSIYLVLNLHDYDYTIF